MQDSYDIFRIYFALKLHFTTDYNYNKSNGRIRITKQHFLKRKDKQLYYSVARKFEDLDEVKQFFIFCLANYKKFTIYSLDMQMFEAYNMWKVRQRSDLVYFKRDLEKIFSEMTLLEAIKGDGVPGIVRMFVEGEISIDTLTIVDVYLKFQPNNEVLPHINKQVTAYKSFLNIKPVSMQKVLIEVIDRHQATIVKNKAN